MKKYSNGTPSTVTPRFQNRTNPTAHGNSIMGPINRSKVAVLGFIDGPGHWSHDRQLVPLAILPGKQSIGLGVVRERLGRVIPVEFAAEEIGDVAEVAGVR
jgi:hypothetical protein